MVRFYYDQIPVPNCGLIILYPVFKPGPGGGGERGVCFCGTDVEVGPELRRPRFVTPGEDLSIVDT